MECARCWEPIEEDGWDDEEAICEECWDELGGGDQGDDLDEEEWEDWDDEE